MTELLCDSKRQSSVASRLSVFHITMQSHRNVREAFEKHFANLITVKEGCTWSENERTGGLKRKAEYHFFPFVNSPVSYIQNIPIWNSTMIKCVTIALSVALLLAVVSAGQAPVDVKTAAAASFKIPAEKVIKIEPVSKDTVLEEGVPEHVSEKAIGDTEAVNDSEESVVVDDEVNPPTSHITDDMEKNNEADVVQRSYYGKPKCSDKCQKGKVKCSKKCSKKKCYYAKKKVYRKKYIVKVKVPKKVYRRVKYVVKYCKKYWTGYAWGCHYKYRYYYKWVVKIVYKYKYKKYYKYSYKYKYYKGSKCVTKHKW